MTKSLKSQKRFFIIVLVVILVSVTIISATVVAASDNDTANSSSSSSSLSEDEINKILEDLQTANNSKDIEAQIDALIQRAILTGNSELKEYAEYLKQYYSISTQLSEIDSKIKALCIKNPELAKINSQMEKSMSTEIDIEQIKQLVPASVASILDKLDSTSLAQIESYVLSLDNIDEMLKNPSSVSEEQKNQIGSAILQMISDQEMLDGDDLKDVKEQIESASSGLSATESQKYTSAERANLKKQSDEFAKLGNKTSAAYPEQVVLLNSSLKLTNCVIVYDGQLLISLNDILRFVDGKMQYTNNSSTMAIESDGYLVEITAGKNVGYSNDKQVSMPVPVLTYNGLTYISVEFYAQAYGLSYTNYSDQGIFVIS